MGWLIYTGVAIFLFTASNILQRVLSFETKNPRAMSALFTFYAALIALTVTLATGEFKDFKFPQERISWIYMVVACVFWGLYERLRFVIANLLDASILSVVSTLSIIVAFVISIFLYDENISAEKLIGIALIILSIIVISLDKNNLLSKKGMYISFVAFSILGIAWSLDKIGGTYFNATTYSIFVWTLPIIVIYLPKITLSEFVYEAKAGGWKLVLMSGITYCAYMAQLKAQILGEATVVIPLTQLFVITTVLSGIVILGEKSQMRKKFIAGVIAVAGAALLV